MTDLETMKKMLDRAGVKYSEEPGTFTIKKPVTKPDVDVPMVELVIQVDNQNDEIRYGYFGFVTCLIFNTETGALITVGALE